MNSNEESWSTMVKRRCAAASEKLKTQKPPEDQIPKFYPADVFAGLHFLRSADRYFAFVRVDLMGGICGGDAIAMHVKDGVAMRTFLFDDGEESLLTDIQPISISVVDHMVDTARDADFFDQPDILKPCSFNSPQDWFGIRDHVGRSKWITIPTGATLAPIQDLLMGLLRTHAPHCRDKIFSRFDDEDDLHDAEEEARDEPENRLTPDA
jgi:hypothetical protein